MAKAAGLDRRRTRPRPPGCGRTVDPYIVMSAWASTSSERHDRTYHGDSDVAVMYSGSPETTIGSAIILVQAVGQCQGLDAGVVEVLEQRHELVAAEPGDGVLGPHLAGGPVGELGQQLVAARVPDACRSPP